MVSKEQSKLKRNLALKNQLPIVSEITKYFMKEKKWKASNAIETIILEMPNTEFRICISRKSHIIQFYLMGIKQSFMSEDIRKLSLQDVRDILENFYQISA